MATVTIDFKKGKQHDMKIRKRMKIGENTVSRYKIQYRILNNVIMKKINNKSNNSCFKMLMENYIG